MKDQNWFAVALDFIIVVVGILIAFQITNWNEARGESKLETYYLERLQSDLSETVDYLSSQQIRSSETLTVIDQFVDNLNNPTLGDDGLFTATTEYFSNGTIIFDFKVTRTTFDDLSRTGNLELVNNKQLTEALIQLHTDYAGQNEDLLVNTDWVTPFEAALVAEFDWFRFDERTQHLFPEKPISEISADIRMAENKLRRHAALHFWVIGSLNRDYKTIIEQSQSVLDLVEKELEKK